MDSKLPSASANSRRVTPSAGCTPAASKPSFLALQRPLLCLIPTPPSLKPKSPLLQTRTGFARAKPPPGSRSSRRGRPAADRFASCTSQLFLPGGGGGGGGVDLAVLAPGEDEAAARVERQPRRLPPQPDVKATAVDIGHDC